MPLGTEIIVPAPVPLLLTMSLRFSRANVAVTFLTALMFTMHVNPLPAHAPLQPVNTEKVSEVAVSATDVSNKYPSEQSVPQLIPGKSEETAPDPLPVFTIDKIYDCRANVAVMFFSSYIENEHDVLMPEHISVQPSKYDPAVGTASSVTYSP